ncbi:MAG: hypothetical protein K0R00_3916 [Herbinix sp.]|nr:hypothetical protein [Herbinix sp.]
MSLSEEIGMGYLEKNKKALDEYKKNLYKGFSSYKSDQFDLAYSVNSSETKDGNKAIVIMKDNNSIRLNSAYRPVNEAEEWAKRFNFNNIGVVVSMFGLGNGIFAKELLKEKNENDLLLIYEPSPEIFLHTLEYYDITDLLQNKTVSISVEGMNTQEYSTILYECVDYTNLNSQIKCVHPQYDRIFASEYADFIKLLENHRIRTVVNKNTEAFWGITMTKNEIKNLKHVKRCNTLEDFINNFPAEVPAIIVSAGPSLDKNIDELVKAKGKAVIFAVDSALKYLLQRDIIPDFVVTLDATKSINHFNDERFKKIPLFCKSMSNPKLLDLHQAKKIFYSNESFLRTLFNKLDKRQTAFGVGGSVATAAFAICIMLGFQRIIMMGQDLCYHGETTHAGGVIRNAHRSGEGATMKVEDIYGNMVKARYDWYTYLLWFEETIVACSEVDVIDATEGGAKIKGTQIMPLIDTIEKYCTKEINVDKLIQSKMPSIGENELSEVTNYFENSLADLGFIDIRAQAAAEIMEDLISAAEKDRISNNENQLKLKRLSQYNKEITDKSIYQLLNDYIAQISTKQLDNINQLSEDRIENQIRTYTKSLEVYKAIHEGAGELKPLLEEAIQSFEAY